VVDRFQGLFKGVKIQEECEALWDVIYDAVVDRLDLEQAYQRSLPRDDSPLFSAYAARCLNRCRLRP
jgi:hypothetical protein